MPKTIKFRPLKSLSKSAAKKVLEAGALNGKKLTLQQKAFYTMVAEGKAPTRLNDISSTSRKRLAA